MLSPARILAFRQMKYLSIVALILYFLIAPRTRAVAQNVKQLNPSSGLDAPANNISDSNSYVGDQICAQCHGDQAESFHQTAHYLTSRLPNKDSILGDFTPGKNAITTSNPDLSFRMEKREGGFFQIAIEGQSPYTTERTERFDFVIEVSRSFWRY